MSPKKTAAQGSPNRCHQPARRRAALGGGFQRADDLSALVRATKCQYNLGKKNGRINIRHQEAQDESDHQSRLLRKDDHSFDLFIAAA